MVKYIKNKSLVQSVRKVINNFRSNLVEFKKFSNDLRILLSLLEFEGAELQSCLGQEVYQWVGFVVQWKIQS
jgi:hypothetical protein